MPIYEYVYVKCNSGFELRLPFIDSAKPVNCPKCKAYQTNEDLTLVSIHSVDLTGLSSVTIYHFRVKSTADNVTAMSNDNIFAAVGGRGGGLYRQCPANGVKREGLGLSKSQQILEEIFYCSGRKRRVRYGVCQ